MNRRRIQSMIIQPFNPPQLSGLDLWLRPNAGFYTDVAMTTPCTTDGDLVAAWADQSGLGNHLTQTTEGDRLMFKKGAFVGKNCVRAVSYLDNRLIIPSSLSTDRRALSVFVACRPSSALAIRVMLDFGSLNWSLTPVTNFLRIYIGSNQNATTCWPSLSPCLLGATGSATEIYAHWNQVKSSALTAAAAGSVTGGMLGSSGASSYHFYGDIAEVVKYNRVLTDGEISKIKAYFDRNYGVLGTFTKEIMFAGDSQTEGYKTGQAGVSQLNYPQRVLESLGAAWQGFVSAQIGYTIPNLITNQAAADQPYSASLYPSKRVIVVWAGTNDLYGATTAAAAYANLVTYCQSRQTTGWSVVVVTCLPRSDAGISADYEAKRIAFNALVVANYATFASALVDVAADARIGDTGDELDTTYYQTDKIHLNDTGLLIISGLVSTAVAAL